MTTNPLPDTFLGRVTVLGQRDGDSALWDLSGRTPRVPLGEGNNDGDTPGVHGLRTLWMRSVPRPVGVRPSGERPFLNPNLLEMFVTPTDDRGAAFELTVDGLRARAKLIAEQRVLVSPAQWHPDFDREAPIELYVPPYSLEEGVLLLDADYASMQKVLPCLVEGSQVAFDRDGVIYFAKVEPPDGSAAIRTRVRLAKIKSRFELTLLTERQDPDALMRWNQVWRAMQVMAQATSATAWSRLSFNVGNKLPMLTWLPERGQKTITVKWDKVFLPPGLVTVTLADQPTESQALGPEQVMTLVPLIEISRAGNVVTLTAGRKETEIDYSFQASPLEEKMVIGAMPMVHSATQVDLALRAAYAPLAMDPSLPVTGFVKVADGWLELPFASAGKFPGRLARTDASDAHGSLLIGLRRRQFQPFGEPAAQVPWSVRLDEPSSFSVRFEFTSGVLTYARVTLKGSAMQVRGLLWLARRAPDGDDALPRADDDPAAFFDVVLNRADAAPGKAPFALDAMVLRAPARNDGDDWESMPIGARAPLLKEDVSLAIDAALLGAGSAQKQRLWMRHPTLPSIQVMPDTRADQASPHPHASRSMALFDRVAGPLTLKRLNAMDPAVDPLPGAPFRAVTAHAPLVALSLPGVELTPMSPTSYSAAGSYGLQVLDESYARAVLPPPENAPVAPPVAADAPPPPTALLPDLLAQMRIDHARRRALAATQASVMFPAGAMNAAIALVPEALAEPRKWTASAMVDPGVSIDGGEVRMGSVAFAQEGNPLWSATGDALLGGYSARLDFSVPGAVRVADGGAVAMRGWSVAERIDAGSVFDGRGVAWSAQLTAANGLLRRALRIEMGAGAGQARSLLSTTRAIEVGGVGDAPWRFALTDLPLTAAGEWKPEPAPQARLHGVEQGWTWTLFEAQATELEALALHGVFRFSPAALQSVKLDGAGRIVSVSIEGALTLGALVKEESDDSRCRVALTLSIDAGALALTDIVPLDDPGRRIAWDLDTGRAGSDLASGVAQLSAKLEFSRAIIKLVDARLEATLFGARVLAPLGTLDVGTAPVLKSFPLPAGLLVLGLESVKLDLASARLLEVGFGGKLRPEVTVHVAEHLTSGDGQNNCIAYMDWFGNRIDWNTVRLDGARAAVSLSEPKRAPAVLFPGLTGGALADGVLCLALGAPNSKGEFPIAQHFAEWQFNTLGTLTITHMMHSLDGHDALRFDGELEQLSLVTWPELAPPQIGAADSIDVEFGTERQVRHRARMQLADHRLDGKWVTTAANGGLALTGSGLEGGAVNWLVEATHSFEWADGTREVRCLHPLQLWNAAKLSEKVTAMQTQFGFTPSYNGRTVSSAYPSIGVRAVVRAFAGIVNPALAQPLKNLGDTWCLLGGVSAWAPGTNEDEYHSLHLPFISALCEPGLSTALHKLMDVPKASAGSILHMSRHDVVTTPVRIDPFAAIDSGRLAKLLPVEVIAPTSAGFPALAMSGTSLAQGWLGSKTQQAEPGWHAEQIQFAGDHKDPPPLPHLFPRAAIMLAALRAAGAGHAQPPLSVLVRFTGLKDNYSVDVQTIRVQPAPVAGREPPVVRASATAADLVIGAPERLATVAVVDAEAAGAGPKQLLALALREVDEPVFIVRRQARTRGADTGSGSFTVVQLPHRRADPLTFATRPLRAASRFATDGRLTWPEPESATDKSQFATFGGPRQPLQSSAQGIGAIAGALAPARLTGGEFTLDKEGGAETTVWLQEWDRIAFGGESAAPEDAPPREYDGVAAVRPLAPSRAAVVHALRRMDAELRGPVQTYLPPRIDDISQSIRSGALAESGVRALRTWGEDWQRSDVRAMAGPAVTRSMRIPRPCATPANSGASGSWRRTVGWYGDAAHSCMTLPGTWDMLAPAPDASGMPAWAVLIGIPTPFGLPPVTGDQAVVWKGAMRIECILLPATADAAAAGPAPAEFVLSLLRQASVQPSSLRTGLRRARGYTPYRSVTLLDRDHLVFWPAADAAVLPDGAECSFECGMSIASGLPTVFAGAAVDVPTPVPRTALDPIEFRTLRLKAIAPAADSFALPLVKRTVLFGDPGYDRRLSEVNPLTFTVPPTAVDGTDGFTFWADRTAVVPGESIVLYAYGAGPYTLTAKVIRNGDQQGARELTFVLDDVVQQKSASISFGATYVTLPTSMLADGDGKALSVGDMLVLELRAALSTQGPARLFIGVKSVSALPAPEALYSLIAVDGHSPRAWCALHSASPRAEGMDTFAPIEATAGKVVRRATFRWSYTEAAAANPTAFSILKTDLETESTHVPNTLEPQIETASARTPVDAGD